MNSKFMLVFLLLIAVVVSGCTSQTTNGDAMEGDSDGDAMEDDSKGDAMGKDNGSDNLTVGNFTITKTDSGYEPGEITIKVGSTITWVNNSSASHWPASARHPTHTLYPGSGIIKCGSGDVILDACVAIEPGDSFSFTFNEVGEWGFHNHLSPSNTGKIIVVE